MTTYAFDLRLNEDERDFVEEVLMDVVESSDGIRKGRSRAEYAQKIIDRLYDNIVEMSGHYIPTEGGEEDGA